MFRRWFWLTLFAMLVLGASRPHAQQGSAPAPAAIPSGALSPEQARAALDTLNDPKKRAAFAATLEALIRGQPEPDPPPPPPPPEPAKPEAKPPEGIAIQLAPDSLGAQVLLTASMFLSNVADKVPRALQAVQSLPLLWGWAVVMATNPLGQQLLSDAAWRLCAVLAVALVAALVLHLLLRRPMARVLRSGQIRDPPRAETDEDPQDRAELGAIEPPRRRGAHIPSGRIALGLARFALEMVPVLGLLVAGHMAAVSSLGGRPGSRLVILAVLDAVAASLTLLAMLTLLFKPDPPGLRLFALRPSAGAYLMRWGRRLILIAVPGYTIGEVALLLGLSQPAHAALQKTVGLVLIVCLAIIIVQRRRSVRRWLSAPPDSTGAVARSRNQLARYWYWVALFFLAAAWLNWTLREPDATVHSLWYFTVTAFVLIAASIARRLFTSLLSPLQPGASPDGSATVLSVRTRLTAYHSAISQLVGLVINVLAFLVLLQIYGLGGLTWLLTSEVGRRVGSGICTMAVTIVLAFAVWEGVNIALQMHLERLRRDSQAARSARLRTLLPLIRTTLAITVAVVAGLMVLSEIGVNIAPLLAGAGIVGVAIGFGSQRLVQDVITGVFLLLENTMQVGDVVRVGDQSGLVESLSVRTIRLRTEDGSVVVMPFSAVTTVTNMTRDYSRAVISANVAADENVDLVIDTMRAIVREMRAEEAWSSIILDDLEVFGLDRFTDTALQIRCRIMCTPFGRWTVGREFNRRLKSRFQVVGIATPFSALKLSLPGPVPEAAAPPETAAAIS